MAISGSTFKMVVTAWTQLAALTPYQLTKVSSQRNSSVTPAEAPGTSAIHGISGLR